MVFDAVLKFTLDRAIRTSTIYTYGTRVALDVKSIPAQATRGRVPARLEQWLIEAKDFEHNLVTQFQGMQVGETRLLVAGTGVGKSTRLPTRIVAAEGGAGLVLMPSDLLAYDTLKYVRSTVVVNETPGVRVEALRSRHLASPLKGNVVYYSGVNSFLCKFYTDKDMVKRLGIKFIYLDEAHERNPDYYFMRLLVGLDWFSDTKIFYGSATAASDVVLVGSPNTPSKIPIPKQRMNVESPELMTQDSPLHFSNISARTLIFVATDAQVVSMNDYYDENDVEVLVYFTYSSTAEFDAIKSSLARKRPVALLSIATLQTGFTLDVDVVVDCGYVQSMQVDYSVPSVDLVVRPVTESERVQRAGRVGRHMKGSAYYCDVDCSPPEPEMTDTTAIYAWLWAQMFNIEIKSKLVSQYWQMFGDVHPRLISSLLNSKLHPVLLLAYMSNSGMLYKGWGIMRGVFGTPSSVEIDSEDNITAVEQWPTHQTGPQLWADQSYSYKSRATFPSQWAAVPYVAWAHYQGAIEVDLDFSDTRSVVSALVSEPATVRFKKRDRTPTVEGLVPANSSSSMKSSTVRPESVMTFVKHERSLSGGLSVPDVPALPAHFRRPSDVSNRSGSSGLHIQPAISQSVRTEEWVDSDSKPKKPKSRSSGSSIERNAIKLRCVDAVKYKHYKLYPMDPNVFERYIQAEHLQREDQSVLERLVSGKVLFASPFRRHGFTQEEHRERQTKYFLSVLRVHNTILVRKMQLQIGEDQSFMARLGLSSVDSSDQKVHHSAKMLNVMAIEGFYVGVDKATLHSGESTSSDAAVISFDADERKATYSLATGTERVRTEVQRVISMLNTFSTSTRFCGVGWVFGVIVLLPAHVYDRYSRIADMTEVLLDRGETSDYAVITSSRVVQAHAKFRNPVDSENVYMVCMDPITKKHSVLGEYVVHKFGEIWCVTKVLDHGYSGSAVVSADDGAFLGMYIGKYMDVDDVSYAHFVPAQAFSASLARCYKADAE